MEQIAPPNHSKQSPGNRPRMKVIVGLLAFTIIGASISSLYSSKQILAESFSVFDARLENLDKTIPVQEQRIAALEEKLKKLEENKSTTNANQVQPAPENAAAPTLNSKEIERINELEKQLAQLKNTPAPNHAFSMGSSIKLLSAFHRLNDKVLAGKSYATELSALQELMSSNEATTKLFASLTPYADNGMPTTSNLLASFDTAKEQQLAAESSPPINASAWERFIFNITHLIQIRRTNSDASDKSIDAVISRAEDHLEREEIEAAIAEIKSLPESSITIFSGWLEDARMNIEALSLLSNLEEHVMTQAFHVNEETHSSIKQQ